eukprot:NODE_6339_length_458_cov_48.547677_g4813_i0.p3 GENE.NODE_6339_length_458_cov_48.547677_g4813_i0~~NODE_6339_length_458_cov_48.547677_g4813_i0.p3  ORF type:complete len:51 (+),score=8.82 NODE_6339_length_458_cov_48.547677_g4813_i0:233-385(+)
MLRMGKKTHARATGSQGWLKKGVRARVVCVCVCVKMNPYNIMHKHHNHTY